MKEHMIETIQASVGGCARHWAEVVADGLLQEGFTKPPCVIGDKVWVIRRYRGVPRPQQGVVYQMYYTDDMQLAIVVKGAGRGLWGERVFPTREACEEYIKAREES